MDLSSQPSNGNYMLGGANLTSLPHVSPGSGGGGNLAGIKSILNSPIASANSLRVVHQKRAQTLQNLQNISGSAVPYPFPYNHVSAVNPQLIANSAGGINAGSGNGAGGVVIGATGTAAAGAYQPHQSQLLQRQQAGNDRVPSLLSDAELLPNNQPVTVLADRYLLLNQIPGSSFFECVDLRNGQPFVCKAIGSSYSKILSAYFRLDGNEHVKPLHRILQVADQTYIFLPPSQYGDLHSFVRERKRLRESEARQLFRQICQTVKSCHDQGIVLRDIKLRKFVFSDRNRNHLKFESLEDAVVLDNPDDDILKEKIGCPAYVAPEILKPNSDFSGKAADLWSLGVVLYTMLVGRYPFNDPDHASLFAKIARCQFTIPDYLSSKARCLIRSLLQKVPKHRLTSEDVLYHPWLLEDDEASGSSYLSSNSWINDLSPDDQRVPELDSMDFT
ncbi:unnamed protein product [Hermetia illucens]|uniref:Protein kinase domain-containing protein n=1 Tax=Hermetia illucens TaxID=343691 RepID=A0A7R8YU27_HERIL|nr:tribbles homolog 2-like [Hermetia illucens]CAD7085687.1 unnamed protein product [Hermetia illucens]